MSRWALILAVLVSAVPHAIADDPEFPPDFESVELPGTFIIATNLVFAADGTLFVVERAGQVSVFKPDGTLQTPAFIDLTDEVNQDGDRGLLSLALQPGWVPDSGDDSWVYLLYTVSPVFGEDLEYNENGQYSFSRLTRYKTKTTSGDITALLTSREVLIGTQLPDGTVPDGIASVHHSHSNGTVVFADDGSLLIATGDGAHYDLTDVGGFDDPAFDDALNPGTGLLGPTPKVQDSGAFRSQDVRSLAGKILRVDPATGLGYPSNPFYTGDPADNASKVWALGLRNPFRMTLVPGTGALDPALGQPNRMVIGDVGLGRWEELNVCRGGENFGWPCWEGPSTLSIYQDFDPPTPLFPNCHTAHDGVLTIPDLAWHHLDPVQLKPIALYVDEQGVPDPAGFRGRCAIGGDFYPGGAYPAEYVGRLFFADYVDGWLKTMEFDGNGDPVAVKDFATDLGGIAGIAAHPITGDLHYIEITGSKIHRIRFGVNLTPTAVAQGGPLAGPSPHTVNFVGSNSHDPDEDPLDYDWDFGDGTPHSTLPDPTHAFLANGSYTVVLTVSDPEGLSDTDELTVDVGLEPLVVHIQSPLPGETYDSPGVVDLVGVANGQGVGPISYEWTIDQHHDGHVHPAVFTSTQPSDVFTVDIGGKGGGVIYFRVNLTVTQQNAGSLSRHVFIYDQDSIEDLTGTSPVIAKMDELVPPFPLGSGQIDAEIVRDGVFPPVGNADPLLQYDTFHGGIQGTEDWIGFELSAPPSEELRFVSLQFQEGMHFEDGGWWEDLRVEVREADEGDEGDDPGDWIEAGNLVIAPDYPFEAAEDDFFDGINHQTYTLHFDPTHGDAIRMIGTPGGSGGYISVGELRARLLRDAPPDTLADVTAGGTVIAKVLGLDPPGPQGTGSTDTATIHNGTFPPEGSGSLIAQYDTFHDGDQNGQDWIGYSFPTSRTLTRLVFQEGMHFPDGGAFDTVAVEVQSAAPHAPWTPVTGLTVTPAYDGLDRLSYETFTFDFDPVAAAAVRLVGDPAGTRDYISVGELRVLGPALPLGCGWTAYGEGLGGSNTLTLASGTPPALGLPLDLIVTGASGPATGLIGVSLNQSFLPGFLGTFLLDPNTMWLTPPFTYNGAGTALLSSGLPNDPQLDGLVLHFQAFALSQPNPYPFRLSNGLTAVICAWQ